MAIEELERNTVERADANVELDVNEVVADDLVEDVSIDGMCGVY
ncbi:mycofactocin precursor MftA [Flexivirga alba]|uniref:Mycofactocin MftA n=1 Tax=Flexivirga alba TaxID=702742 RepID=A0ABW2AAE6_9MICO